MKRAVTTNEMVMIDRLAQKKYGIPSLILMENAGRISAEEILKEHRTGKVAIFCGKGNNGGDGFVCARYLTNKGLKVTVFILGKIDATKKKDPFINLTILKKIGVTIKEIVTKKDIEKVKRSFNYDLIVDAIFGIGFKGALPEGIRDIVSFLNATQKPIYSLDVPSGLDATSGKRYDVCIEAHKTITFGFPKVGFFNPSAKPCIGKLVVADIGFPRQFFK